MKLYNNKTAPSPRRARMLIHEKQVEVELVEIDLASGAHLSADYLAKVPTGTVPALELDSGEVITENLGIAAYLEAVAPDVPLLGATAFEKARAAEWNARVEYLGLLSIQDALRNKAKGLKGRAFPGPKRYDQIPALAERGRRRIGEFMEVLNTQLSGNRYVAGDFYSIANITATVAVDFAAWVHVPIPEDATALIEWHDRMKKRGNYGA